MANNFKCDVFLSRSSKDKPVVRAVAERLRADGLKVWFDEWMGAQARRQHPGEDRGRTGALPIHISSFSIRPAAFP
jgi:hypothetical protein